MTNETEEAKQHLQPISKDDPKFNILFRDGNWCASEDQLTEMMKELVKRHNILIDYLKTKQ